jgi:hypothetical protein
MRMSSFPRVFMIFGLAALAVGCRDEVSVRVETAGIAPGDVVLEVEHLGTPDETTLEEVRTRGDIDGAALLSAQDCGAPCRAALVTLFVRNTGAERAAPPVVRFSAPDGKPARVPVAFRGDEISPDRTGRIRFLVSLWPGEKVLTVRVSGSVFIEVLSDEPDAGPTAGAAPHDGPPPPPLPFQAYGTGFLDAFQKLMGAQAAVTLNPRDLPADVPRHEVHALTPKDGPAVVFTVGAGRLPQPSTAPTDDHAHVELLAYAPAPSANTAQILSGFARLLHQRTQADGAWKPNDTLRLAKPVHGLQHFALQRRGSLRVERGPEVTFLALVPLTPAEYGALQGKDVKAWLDAAMADEPRWGAMRARWGAAPK